ncbi:hypothetical protein HMPREF1986_02191, partial [Oribacterium sp. oral taxon 078 str. F0263]|uniref:hypothetical protein n=1 Tax=Oribacterium sp. oral taxon 078 TaxID=652706 RepID=UPI0003ADA9CF
SPSGISVLLIIYGIASMRISVVSVPFGDIGSSNNYSAYCSKCFQIVSVPFGDIGSSNKIVKLIRREIKKFPSPSGISVLLMCYGRGVHLRFFVSVPFGDIGS